MRFTDVLKQNSLHANREYLALTQAEVGNLLGLSDDAIHNYENGRRAPLLSTTLGLELLFGHTLAVFYPGLARTVAEDMLPRLQQLSIEVEAEEGPKREDRQRAITAIGNRLSSVTPLA